MILKSTCLYWSFFRKTMLLLMIALPAISSGSENTSFHKAEFQNHLHLQTDEVQFEEEVIYSEPAEIMFGNIVTSAVDVPGRVFMGDNDQKMTHVLNPDGSYLHSFGSRGNGPGEFQMISKIAVDHIHIHVFDMIMGRINIFDAHNFNFIRTVALSENGGRIQRGTTENAGLGRPFDFHLLTDGNYLVSFRNFRDPGQRQTAVVSPSGEILEENRFEFRAGADEIIESSSGNMRRVVNFPFSRSTRLTVSTNGLLVCNWTEHLEFDLYDESGKHILTFSYPFQNARMDRREVLKMYENIQGQGIVMGAGGQGGGGGGGASSIQQMLQDIELPDTWPAVDQIYADAQNRLWVSSFTENSDERKWFLFDEPGRLVGTFTWPASRSVVYADNQIVYVLERPLDDLDSVIRYRFNSND